MNILINLYLRLSEILEMKRKGAFFSYLGVFFSVVDETVSDIEHTIREILLKLEEKYPIHQRETPFMVKAQKFIPYFLPSAGRSQIEVF